MVVAVFSFAFLLHKNGQIGECGYTRHIKHNGKQWDVENN